MMSKNKVIIIAVFFIIMFFLFRHCARMGASIIETVSSSVLYPLLRVQNATLVPLAQWFDDRATMHDLRNHVAHLQKLNEELYAENNALKSLCVYETETRELRAFNKRYALHNGHLVQVLARHFSPTKQFFLVDAGTSHGIKKDMVALYGNNIVGRVSQVYPWYCEVCLITDADCKVAATCLSKMQLTKKNAKGASGIHEGINDAKYTTVTYVSHLESVNVHDTVLSSGEGLVFPKGFALGKIVAAEKGELFYEIRVQSLLDLQNLQCCTLIAKEDIG
jgi:cell shape-determining protein MreC